MTNLTRAASAAALLMLASPAAAELELSFYLGVQGAPDSTASGYLPDGTSFNRKVNWSGKSFDGAIYYGGRATWWTASDFGFGVEGTHAKAYASSADRAAIGTDRLEFSDGHNIFTANVMKRFPNAFEGSNFSPYVGAGVGIAVPHVDIQVSGSNKRTHGFETTGVAFRGIAGVKYEISEHWGLFGEYQFTWSDNDATIKADPSVPGQTNGKFRTELWTHAINIGVSYSF